MGAPVDCLPYPTRGLSQLCYAGFLLLLILVHHPHHSFSRSTERV